MIITYDALKAKQPCVDQFKVYCKNFPDNWTVTKEGCLKAVKLKLGLDWFGLHFLSATARKAYDKARAPAWKAYDKARAPAWKAYSEATATALWKVIKDYKL